jgi:hypothetical protein
MSAASPKWACLVLLGQLALGVGTTQGQEAVYRVSGRQLPVSLVANGQTQTVTPDGEGSAIVRVATSWSPVGARGTYGAVRLAAHGAIPEGFALPPALSHRLLPEESAFEAATRILEWVMAQVRLDPEDRSPQDASSVLERRRGRCSGLANLTAALLIAAGFEARTVSGLLVDDDGATPHRWVECELPGAGWVATDPTLGLWTLTPRHLAFAEAVTDAPEVRTLALSESHIGLLPHRHGLPLRPNDGTSLVCRLVGVSHMPWPVGVLHGPTGETRRSLLQPEGRFQQLLPGRWLLVVELDGKVLARRQLELEPGSVHSLAVELHRGSEVGS